MTIVLKAKEISLNKFFGAGKAAQFLRSTLKKYWKEEVEKQWPKEHRTFPYDPPYTISFMYCKNVRMDVDNLIVIPKLFMDAIQPWLIPDDKLVEEIRIAKMSNHEGVVEIDITCMDQYMNEEYMNEEGREPEIYLEIPEHTSLIKSRDRANKKNRARAAEKRRLKDVLSNT